MKTNEENRVSIKPCWGGPHVVLPVGWSNTGRSHGGSAPPGHRGVPTPHRWEDRWPIVLTVQGPCRIKAGHGMAHTTSLLELTLKARMLSCLNLASMIFR